MFGRDYKKWQESTMEEVIEKELPIFDPHIHLWHPLTEDRGFVTKLAILTKWMPLSMREMFLYMVLPKSVTNTFTLYNFILDDYDLKEYFFDVRDHNVTKILVVESGWHSTEFGEDHQFSNVSASKRCAERSRELLKLKPGVILGVVGYVDLSLGRVAVEQGVRKHLEVNRNVKGFRHQLTWHENANVYSSPDAQKDLYKSKKFREGLSVLSDLGLTYDTWAYYFQIPQVQDIAESFPDLTIILDHIGAPLGIDDWSAPEKKKEVWKEWKRNMENISKCPNVFVKVSGFLMAQTGIDDPPFHSKSKAPTSDEVVAAIYPWFETTVDLFGVDRCMFASNFPVDKCNVSFHVLFNAYKKCCNKYKLDQASKRKMFHDNAVRVYSFDSDKNNQSKL